MFRWTVHLDGGPRRVNHAAVVVGSYIYSFGGYCTGDNFEIPRPIDIHVLDTLSYRWSVLEYPESDDTPYHRYGHTASGWHDLAFIFGGRNDKDGASNKLHCFNPRLRQWSCPAVCGEMPGARDGHSSCVINDRMFIFGGFVEREQRFSDEVHALTLTTMSWCLLRVQEGRPARWRDFHSATPMGNKMYVFGGRSDRSGPHHTNSEMYCNKIQVFDTVNLSWHEPEVKGIKPYGRRSHSAFVYNGELYILGGYNGCDDMHFDDMFKFNPVDCTWTAVTPQGKGMCARRRQCCCLVKDRLYIFGGTRPCYNDIDDEDCKLIDLADLHVMDLVPSLRMLCMTSVLDHKLDISCLPHDVRWELKAMTTDSTISRQLNSSG